MKRGIVEDRLNLALSVRHESLHCVCEVALKWSERRISETIYSGRLVKYVLSLPDEEIKRIAQFLDVDEDWLCGSGPVLPPFGEFER